MRAAIPPVVKTTGFLAAIFIEINVVQIACQRIGYKRDNQDNSQQGEQRYDKRISYVIEEICFVHNRNNVVQI